MEIDEFEFFSGEDPRDPQEVMNNVQIGETANGVTKVTGLTVEGVYTFKATAVDLYRLNPHVRKLSL